MTQSISKCRSCGASIIWIRTKAGKNMPVDSLIHSIRRNPKGKENLVTPAGEVVRGDIVSSDEAEGNGYISHFATCPYAMSHRKKK